MRLIRQFLHASTATATLAAAVALSTPAFAQDEAADEGGLEEIVVTAQRRSENLQDIPISVDVVSGDKLDAINSGGGDIRAFAGRVPSLNIESSFGRTFPRFYIRGLGNTDFDLNASQPVSLVYDDVVLENPILKGFPVFDVERVEVLRGPQGTLFGRNTPAGIVKFDSVRPDKAGANYVKGSFGRYNSASLEGAVGGNITESISARASVSLQTRSDWVDNIDTATDKNDLESYSDVAARLQVQFAPSETFKLRLTGQYRDFGGTARVFRANLFRPGTNDLRGLASATSEFRREDSHLYVDNVLAQFGISKDIKINHALLKEILNTEMYLADFKPMQDKIDAYSTEENFQLMHNSFRTGLLEGHPAIVKFCGGVKSKVKSKIALAA